MLLTPGGKIIQIHSTRREHHLLCRIDNSDDNRALVNIQGNETLSRNSCKREVYPPCSGNDQNESTPFGFRSIHTPIRAALFHAPSLADSTGGQTS
jgi:hypothetical protein